MAERSRCAQGHEWADGAERCPTCGGAALLVVPTPGPFGAETLNYAPKTTPAPDPNAATLGPEEAAWVMPVERPRVGGYEIVDELGRGGMGVVYRAEQLSLKRQVALKMILAGSHAGKDHKSRFHNEAEAVAKLQHPNIVQIFEIGEHEGKPYLALEYVDGGSLAERLSAVGYRPSADYRQTARLVECLARAVHHAHQRHIIHRDLKPGNVLLMRDGTPKITDFGLAKQLQGDTPASGHGAATVTGAIMGTPSYMAPEQADGKKNVIGPATDIYALGAMLYELLTGEPPFKGDSPMSIAIKVVTEEPRPPRRLQARVPGDLETICLKCLEKDPAKRYTTAEALAEDLRRFQQGDAISARRVGVIGRTSRWMLRRWKPVALVASGVFLTIGFFVCLGVLDQLGLLDSATDNAKNGPLDRMDESERDLRSFHGNWAIVAVIENGREAPAQFLTNARVTCTGKRFAYQMPGEAGEAIIHINAATSPRQADFTAAGIEGGKLQLLSGLSIYQWKQDAPETVVVCFHPDGKTRPTEFTANAGSGRVMITMKRIKEPAVAQGDLERLQGTWIAETLESNGFKAPPQVAAACRITFDGNRFIRDMPQNHRTEGIVLLSPTRKPKEVDGIHADDPSKTLPGIYEFDGDRLRLCFGKEGGVRPGEFTTPAGSGRGMAVYRRARPAELPRDSAAKPDTGTPSKERFRPNVLLLSEAKLIELGIAMHNFVERTQPADGPARLPAGAIYSKDGKPLLSWRVALLPYLDETELFKQFKLDEPWDSPSNIKLLPRIPKVYMHPTIKNEKGDTYYQVITGKGTLFDGPVGAALEEVMKEDGLANTLLIVEGAVAVPWTKPQDLPYEPGMPHLPNEPRKPLPRLGFVRDASGQLEYGFNACFGDGAVRFLGKEVSEKTLRAVITRNGGEPVDVDKLEGGVAPPPAAEAPALPPDLGLIPRDAPGFVSLRPADLMGSEALKRLQAAFAKQKLAIGDQLLNAWPNLIKDALTIPLEQVERATFVMLDEDGDDVVAILATKQPYDRKGLLERKDAKVHQIQQDNPRYYLITGKDYRYSVYLVSDTVLIVGLSGKDASSPPGPPPPGQPPPKRPLPQERVRGKVAQVRNDGKIEIANADPRAEKGQLVILQRDDKTVPGGRRLGFMQIVEVRKDAVVAQFLPGQTIKERIQPEDHVFFTGRNVTERHTSIEDLIWQLPSITNSGPLQASLQHAAGKHHLALGVNLTLPKFKNLGARLPPQFQVAEPLTHAGALTLTADFHPLGLRPEVNLEIELRFHYANDGLATKGLEAANATQALLREALPAMARFLNSALSEQKSDWASLAAPMAYVVDELGTALQSTRVVSRTGLAVQASLSIRLDFEHFAASFGKATEKVRDAAERMVSQNNLKQIALAFDDYEKKHGTYPPVFSRSADNKPLLSWRVLLLPHFQEPSLTALHKRFRLDEPWDSPHNRTLMVEMPGVYLNPRVTVAKGVFGTQYQRLAGEGTAAEPSLVKGLRKQDIIDGLAATISVVEADKPVAWTKPDDADYDPKRPLPKLGGIVADGFNAVFLDGRVRFFSADFDAKTLRALITRSGGEKVEVDKLP